MERPTAAQEMAMELPGSASPSLFVIFVFSLFSFLASSASGGVIGVDYGRVADNLPSPGRVVDLLKTNGIGAVRIYDTNVEVLRALSGSGIKVAVALPNDKLAGATNPDVAGTWVWENIGKYYPNTQIHAIAVGNEVFHQRPDLSSSIVPAMWNVYNALNNLGLAGAIKVSSPVAFSAVAKSFPPSEGIFRGDLQPVVRQMLDFIRRTDSYFTINLYPYITYMDNPQIDLNYALGLPNDGVRDPRTGLMYYSLFDAQLDALYSAMAALGFGDTASPMAGERSSSSRWKAAVWETGHPVVPRRPSPRERMTKTKGAGAEEGIWNASLVTVRGPTAENAQAYNGNLIKRILDGKTGTPLHPGAGLDVYIFSLFNENLKQGAETERNFGLFYPDGNKVYDVNFRPGGGDSWCVADPAAGSQRLQAALEYACGQGGADCAPIQRGAACYEPNTVEAHASYAMNSYYQKHGRGAGTCDFKGAGRVVYQRPVFGNCKLPSSS